MKHILFIITLALILSCKTTSSIPLGSNLLDFNSEYWKSLLTNKDEIILENDDRQKMLKDLIVNVLPGKTKDEIILLLGDSELMVSGNKLRYATGWDRTSYMAGVDSEWLVISFNSNNEFVAYTIFVD